MPTQRMIRPAVAAILGSLAVGPIASADILKEPSVLSSANSVLDVLMVARAAPIETLQPFRPTGWVYDICERPADGSLSCPQTTTLRNLYGGTRLSLKPGDLLKVRLVNRLPPVTDSDHAQQSGHEFLSQNPTNLHTHGLLVSPRFPTIDNPTYGDNVYVMTLNSANGQLPSNAMIHGDVRIDYTDYAIQIPKSHPSGLFWFHPHVHGIALNQVSAGLAGAITIGNVGDYVCGNDACAGLLARMNVRHILLKDTQILKSGVLKDQEDPGFCSLAAGPGKVWRGFCPGVNTGEDQGDYRGGRWYFTLNGQPYPTISASSPVGEIWRIVSASGSASYNLSLWSPKQNRSLLFQVLAVDGIAVSGSAAAPTTGSVEVAGARIHAVPCPDSPKGLSQRALCARSILMMPSSRAELWVVDRDAQDRVVSAQPGDSAILRNSGVNTGPDGDDWPAVDLAQVKFSGSGSVRQVPEVLPVSSGVTARRSDDLSSDLRQPNRAVGTNASCTPLAAGHVRRIFFNAPSDDPDAFGLGYEELGPDGKTVPGTFREVKPFDPATPTVCLPLGPGNSAVHEHWQLVNLAGEDHNFHIHQLKFSVLKAGAIESWNSPDGVLVDNVPVPHADRGTCQTVEDWRAGKCKAHPVDVDIPFSIAGDFVYHCHILEHEDGGMMARIRVRAAPPS